MDVSWWRSEVPSSRGLLLQKALHDAVDSGSVENRHVDDLAYEMGILLPVLGAEFYKRNMLVRDVPAHTPSDATQSMGG